MSANYTVSLDYQDRIVKVKEVARCNTWALGSIGMVRTSKRSAEALMDYMKACETYRTMRDTIVGDWTPDWNAQSTDALRWKRFHTIDHSQGKVTTAVAGAIQTLPEWRYFPNAKGVDRLERMVDPQDIYLVINGPIA